MTIEVKAPTYFCGIYEMWHIQAIIQAYCCGLPFGYVFVAKREENDSKSPIKCIETYKKCIVKESDILLFKEACKKAKEFLNNPCPTQKFFDKKDKACDTKMLQAITQFNNSIS